jgi:hypothetical protein
MSPLFDVLYIVSPSGCQWIHILEVPGMFFTLCSKEGISQPDGVVLFGFTPDLIIDVFKFSL